MCSAGGQQGGGGGNYWANWLGRIRDARSAAGLPIRGQSQSASAPAATASPQPRKRVIGGIVPGG